MLKFVGRGQSWAKADFHAGLFGTVWGGHIKNLGVINADISGVQYAGSVISGLAGGGSTIESCYSVGTLNLSSNGQSSGITISQDGTTIKNCYTSYSNISNESNSGCPIVNCKTGLSSTCYLTGELAYLLNTNKQTDETCSWGQTIGTDAHPVALVEGSNNVYKQEMSQEATNLEIKADYPYNRWTTLCFPNEVALPEKVKAFTVTGTDENSTDNYLGFLIMNKVDADVVPANTPVILMNTGTETATISLPAVTAYYTNSTTASGIIEQDGNLLKGTYSQLTLDRNKQYGKDYSYFYRTGTTLSTYQCYLEIENGKSSYHLETAEPVGDIEYTVLSEDEKTC